LEAHGYEPSTRVLDIDRQTADSALAADLKLQAGEQVLLIRKLFLENELPVILTLNYLPLSLIEEPAERKDFIVPIFNYLSESAGQHLSYYLSEIVPVLADDELAEMLHVPSPTAVLSIEEVGYNEENDPILKAHSYFRDDLLRLGIIRRKV
jgi:GntR family transcriptional regulator